MLRLAAEKEWAAKFSPKAKNKSGVFIFRLWRRNFFGDFFAFCSKFNVCLQRKSKNVPLREPLREEGGAYSFVACLSRLTIDHASLSRRSTGGGRRRKRFGSG